jgi:hypothetical protein
MIGRTDEGVGGDIRWVGVGELDVDENVEDSRTMCCGRTQGGVVFPPLLVAMLLFLG